MQSFRKAEEQSYPAEIAVEYAPETGRCRLNISFAGAAFNLLDGLDEISTNLLKGVTERIDYEYLDAERKNILTADVG